MIRNRSRRRQPRCRRLHRTLFSGSSCALLPILDAPRSTLDVQRYKNITLPSGKTRFSIRPSLTPSVQHHIALHPHVVHITPLIHIPLVKYRECCDWRSYVQITLGCLILKWKLALSIIWLLLQINLVKYQGWMTLHVNVQVILGCLVLKVKRAMSIWPSVPINLVHH